MSTKFECYITGDDVGNTFGRPGTIWATMSFTPERTHDVTSVKLLMYRVGSPGTITASIRATTTSTAIIPTGADIDGTTGTTNGNTLTTNTAGEYREITLDSVVRVSAGTAYAIVVRATSGDNSNYVVSRVDDSGGTYLGGNYQFSLDSGSSWGNPSSDREWLFEEWGDAAYITYPADRDVGGGNQRVTGLVHVYDRVQNIYDLEFQLGEVSTDKIPLVQGVSIEAPVVLADVPGFVNVGQARRVLDAARGDFTAGDDVFPITPRVTPAVTIPVDPATVPGFVNPGQAARVISASTPGGSLLPSQGDIQIASVIPSFGPGSAQFRDSLADIRRRQQERLASNAQSRMNPDTLQEQLADEAQSRMNR